jgi:TonB family protein
MKATHRKPVALYLATVLSIGFECAVANAREEPAPTSPTVVDIRGIWKDTKLDEEGAAARGLTASDIVTPRKTKNVFPIYPDAAKTHGIQGKVYIECTIGVAGVPTGCAVTRGRHAALDEAALECVRQWRYAPLTVRGVPAPALVEFYVAFKLS